MKTSFSRLYVIMLVSSFVTLLTSVVRAQDIQYVSVPAGRVGLFGVTISASWHQHVIISNLRTGKTVLDFTSKKEHDFSNCTTEPQRITEKYSITVTYLKDNKGNELPDIWLPFAFPGTDEKRHPDWSMVDFLYQDQRQPYFHNVDVHCQFVWPEHLNKSQ